MFLTDICSLGRSVVVLICDGIKQYQASARSVDLILISN